MSKARKWARMFTVLVLACAVGVTFAGPAQAGMSKAQKRKAAAKLVKQLKKNPRLIKSKRWLKKAGHVDATLPLTVRLNPIVTQTTSAGVLKREAASNDTALIDLSSTFGPEVGQKTTTIRGTLGVLARFGNPAEGDDLGDLRLEVTSADLTAASVGVLDGPVNCGPSEPARVASSFQEDAPAGLDPEYASRTSFIPSTTLPGGASVSRSSLAPSVGPSTVVRTAPIDIGKADVSRTSNRGKANLFTGTVELDLHLSAVVNTIFRSLEDGTGDGSGPVAGLPSALFYCDEAFAARTDSSGLTTDSFATPVSNADIGPPMHQNIITQKVSGSLQISPAITSDGKLRIAKVNVGGDWRHSSIDACLQVHSVLMTNGGGNPAAGDSPVSVGFGSVQGAGALGGLLFGPSGQVFFLGGADSFAIPAGTDTGILAPLVNQKPTTTCDAAYPASPGYAPVGGGASNAQAWPMAINYGSTTALVEELPAGAERLELDPEIKVNSVTAEALIGSGFSY